MNRKKDDWKKALKVDFSEGDSLRDSLKERLLSEISMNSLEKQEDIVMQKKVMRISTRVALVAAISLVFLTGVALAAMKTFSLGPYAKYTQMEVGEADIQKMEALFEQLNGQVFDAEGQPIDDVKEHLQNGGKIYDKQGVEQQTEIEGEGWVLSPRAGQEDVKMHQYDELEDVRPRVNFDIPLPDYLPEEYELKHFETYAETDNDYLTLVFERAGVADGRFDIHLAKMNEETAFEVTTDGELREVEIAGHKAIVDGGTINLLLDDVMLSFTPKASGISVDEMMKVAESMVR